MKNLFSSDYNSRLFRSIHNNQGFPFILRIDLSRNYGNADMINFIDERYVKTENTTVLEWLRSIIGFMSIIASKDANLDWATLWIPKQSLPGPVHFLSKEIIGEHNPQGWELNIHLYNAVEFAECTEAWCYAVQLWREDTERNQYLIKFQPSLSEAKMYNFNKCLKKQNTN